jgi:hypothetical protein
MRDIIMFHGLDWVTQVIGADISDVAPKNIPGVKDKTDTILGWVKMLVLIMIPIMGFVGIIMVPAGKLSGNRMVGNVGFSLLGITALCAMMYAVIIPIFSALV